MKSRFTLLIIATAVVLTVLGGVWFLLTSQSIQIDPAVSLTQGDTRRIRWLAFRELRPRLFRGFSWEALTGFPAEAGAWFGERVVKLEPGRDPGVTVVARMGRGRKPGFGRTLQLAREPEGWRVVGRGVWSESPSGPPGAVR